MKVNSNTLHVMLPLGMDMHSAAASLRVFGDIGRLELYGAPDAEALSVTVSFFDVRAARHAAKTWGAQYCWPGEQCGERRVKVPGDVRLKSEDYAKVSGMQREDPQNGGENYVMEFFDVRDAARVRSEMARRMAKARAAKEPAYVNPTCSATPSAASNEAVEQLVSLRNLPNALSSSSCLAASLEQAGVKGEVVSTNISQGKKGSKLNSCEAVVKVTGVAMADRCIAHFHGRTWDPSGAPVSASRMAPAPHHLPATRLQLTAGLTEVAESRLPPPPGLEGFQTAKEADTEESTDAGASELDEYQDEYQAAVEEYLAEAGM